MSILDKDVSDPASIVRRVEASPSDVALHQFTGELRVVGVLLDAVIVRELPLEPRPHEAVDIALAIHSGESFTDEPQGVAETLANQAAAEVI